MFLHPPQWKKRVWSRDANTNMNCFSGSQFPMNHQSHSLSEIQIWMWPEHLPITALRCCHSPSSGINKIILIVGCKGRISIKPRKTPGTLIGFDGHFPGKLALKILLRHSVAARYEVSITLVSLADGPLSVVVDVPPIRILFLISRLAPCQHALFPSEIAKGERDFQIISHASRRGRGASGRNSGTIRGR